MPADSRLDNSHVDFLLQKLRNYVQDIDSQSHNLTHLDTLLISTASSSPLTSKFALFFWTTCSFIAITMAIKSIPYLKLAKSAIKSIWKYLYPVPTPFLQAPQAQDNFIFLQQPHNPHMAAGANSKLALT